MTPAPDATRYRSLMGRWATGVSVVTAHDASGDAGLTVNALLSVSVTPPSLLVSLSQDADTLPVLERSGFFGVSFLSAPQRSVSERFALTLPSEEKFRGVGFRRGPHGSPLLDGSLGALECRVVSRSPTLDHVLIVGEVVHGETGTDAAPLVYFRSAYSESDGPDHIRLPPHP